MKYPIEQFIPFHLNGFFEKDNNLYTYEFTHSCRELGLLYIEGNAYGKSAILKTSDLITFDCLYGVGFKPVLDKIMSLHRVDSKITLEHYLLLIRVSSQPGQGVTTKFISVIFTDTIMVAVLPDGTQIDIRENNIQDFLINIDTYNLG